MTAIQLMSALAQPTRLNVFTILSRHQPNGLPVGELAALAETPQNTMSSHLAILSRAGAVASRKRGRTVTYSVRREAIQELAMFLLESCCRGANHVSSEFLNELNRCCGDGNRTSQQTSA